MGCFIRRKYKVNCSQCVFIFFTIGAVETGFKPNGCSNKKLNACLFAVIFFFYFSSPLPDPRSVAPPLSGRGDLREKK